MVELAIATGLVAGLKGRDWFEVDVPRRFGKGRDCYRITLFPLWRADLLGHLYVDSQGVQLCGPLTLRTGARKFELEDPNFPDNLYDYLGQLIEALHGLMAPTVPGSGDMPARWINLATAGISRP